MSTKIYSREYLERSRVDPKDFTRNRKMPFPKLMFCLLNGVKTSIQNHIEIFFENVTDESLDTAIDFLGPGYKDLGGGRFQSLDGSRQVRMGNNDIMGNHGGGPHINFEILGPNPRNPNRMIPTDKIHIYIY